MSGSLASARMKSLQPRGSAWIRFSFTSRVFSTARHLTLARTLKLAKILPERRITDHDAPQAHARVREPNATLAEKQQPPQREIDNREDRLRPEFLIAHPP